MHELSWPFVSENFTLSLERTCTPLYRLPLPFHFSCVAFCLHLGGDWYTFAQVVGIFLACKFCFSYSWEGICSALHIVSRIFIPINFSYIARLTGDSYTAAQRIIAFHSREVCYRSVSCAPLQDVSLRLLSRQFPY